jgi:hypothetical protein
MGKGFARALTIAAVLLLVGVGSALAARQVIKVHLQAGNIIVIGEGGFAPETLPRNVDAPIEIFGKGHLETADGTYPPILKTIQFEFDKHGSVDTTGLAKCSAAKLQATTVAAARKLCPGAIVGTGFGKAVVLFPEQGPIPASSAITLFNGPEIGGDPSVLAHAHLTVPAPTTFIVPIRIETIHNGRYGYRVKAEIPRIAGGYGHPIAGSIRVGRKWTHKGEQHSFANARCADGRLQAVGEFTFKDGTSLKGTFLGTCKTRD